MIIIVSIIIKCIIAIFTDFIIEILKTEMMRGNSKNINKEKYPQWGILFLNAEESKKSFSWLLISVDVGDFFLVLIQVSFLP